jgi:hypothetical protein
VRVGFEPVWQEMFNCCHTYGISLNHVPKHSVARKCPATAYLAKILAPVDITRP